jgi:hypothetical protein
MPLSFDLTDRLARFPHAYSYQPVRGWGVKSFETGLAQSIQRTKQQALGEGPWDGVERLYADAFPIEATDYTFHPGEGDDAPDLYFPDDPPHPWTAYISARGMAGLTADQTDKLFGVYRTLRTPDFDGAGVQIDINGDPIGGGDPRDYYFFKPNPANVAADQILRWGQRLPGIVNFPAWVDWRDWNWEEIPWDDSKYTPRSLSLTPTSGGSLTPGQTYYLRVAGMKGSDESSASQQTIETVASSILLESGQTAFQVNWLVREDVTDHTAFRVYIGTTAGVWLGYFNVANPALRTLLITTTAGVTAGSPLDEATTGLLRDIHRFECGLFFVPPYSLSASLDRICQISCADWQWSGLGTETYRNDKVRFMSPVTRDPVFTLDHSQVSPGSFKTWAVDRRSRVNQIIGNFRDRDDEFLSEGTPVVLNREQMQEDDGQVKTFSIDFGTCYRSQVQRAVSFWARQLCDLDQLAILRGSPKTYHVLPGDVVEVTNETADWEAQQFIVRKKQENIETNIGDPLTMQVYSPDAYSDTDHSPLPSPLRQSRFDPFSAPPVASDVVLTIDDRFLTGIIADFAFGLYEGKQIGRMYIKGPADSEPDDSEYRMVDSVDPNGSLVGHLEARAIVGGKYWVKITTESAFGITDPSGHPEAMVDLRPAAVSEVGVFIAADGDFLIQFTSNARTVEEPATFSVDVYNDDFTALLGTLPVTSGGTHAALMNSVHVSYDPPDATNPDEEVIPIPGYADGTMSTSTATDKNNLFSLPWDGVSVPGPESGSYVSGVTLEAIESNRQRFDATMQWLGADGGGSAALMTVALQTRANANPVSDLFTPDLSVSPLSVTWEAGTLAGTVKETIKSFGVTVGTPRDNLDPGFGSSAAEDLDALAYETYRRGQRYSFLVAGNEYRLVLNFGAQNQQTLAIVSADADGPDFPLRLAAETTQDLNGSMAVMNITRGGDQLSTILSVANQIAFFGHQIDVPGMEHCGLEIYQNAKAPLPSGIPVRIVIPPL